MSKQCHNSTVHTFLQTGAQYVRVLGSGAHQCPPFLVHGAKVKVLSGQVL